MELNLASLARHFSDESAAYELVEQMRWADGPVCPHCGEVGHAYFLKARNGYRRTSTGATTYRRLWKCASCRKQFSVLVGTIFESSKVPLSKWLLAIYMMCADKNGVAAFELHRTLGVTNKTAWFMAHRIREAMKAGPLADMMRGTVVADETFIGGRHKNRHNADREPHRATTEPVLVTPGERSTMNKSAANKWAQDNKVAVLSLIDRDRGEVRSRVVADVTGATLRKVIAAQVDMSATVLHTDEWAGYKTFRHELAGHQTVNHKHDEYVRWEGGQMVTSNQAENYFSQLKRSLDGTHHHVSREHLPRYLAEFDFRYSTRKMSDGGRMERLMGKTGGRRLTYRATTAG